MKKVIITIVSNDENGIIEGIEGIGRKGWYSIIKENYKNNISLSGENYRGRVQSFEDDKEYTRKTKNKDLFEFDCSSIASDSRRLL